MRGPRRTGCRRSARAARSECRRCGWPRACGRRRRRPSRRCPSNRPAAGWPGRRPGRGRPSTAAAGGSRRRGTTSGRSGSSGRPRPAARAMYCCAAAYLPSYWDSASITRQSAPAATASAPMRRLAGRVVAVDELPGADPQAVGVQRPATRPGVELGPAARRAVGALDEHGRHPAAWARAAIAATSPPSVRGSSQIHMPLPWNGAGSAPGPSAASGPTRGRGGHGDLLDVRAPAGPVGDGDAHAAGAGPGRDPGDVADPRVVELGGQRAARPAERDAHALVDALARELELAPDRRP